MLLGYNLKRPVEQDYSAVEERLVRGLEPLGQAGLSLLLFGSYVRGEHVPGISDIDGVMTFPDDVIIDKGHLAQVGAVLHHALGETNLPFQVCVSDITIMRDGRFNTYDPSFKTYFMDEGRQVVGPDYRPEFRYELPTMDGQTPVRFNLRKARIGLLFAHHHMERDYEMLLRNFTKTLDSVSRASKQVLHFTDGKLRTHRFGALGALEDAMPDLDVEPLLRIKYLFQHPHKLDEMYKRPNEVMDLWNSSVSFFEKMIHEYIRRNPRPKDI